jgi:hypothetical protein
MQQSADEKTAARAYIYIYIYIYICKRWPRGGEVGRWGGGEVERRGGRGLRDEAAPPQNTTGLRFQF